MYHYIKYPSGNTYVMKDVEGKNKEWLLEVVYVVRIEEAALKKSVGSTFHPLMDINNHRFYKVEWTTGDLEQVTALAALEVL